MTATPTIEARLAEVLPCYECHPVEHRTGCPAVHRPAILALIRTLLREERERCANEPFAALRRDALDPNVSMDKMKRWNSLSPGALWMRDAIHALEDRP